ncbi:hypothetical protein [Streptomyces afghaniensis]|uniref:hypothetical protein n=1 Tax=Streptomyces afghaniensis TaxID=66865 RepID=UPI00278BA345|nr:hypothetical protein [Streptomyces afghaniensis]MDQ1013631.1 ATP-dependent DNA ligase [Streptomyces afghaniensis]
MTAKWDGFRALFSIEAGKVVLRSRRDTDMGPAFPEIVPGAAQFRRRPHSMVSLRILD